MNKSNMRKLAKKRRKRMKSRNRFNYNNPVQIYWRIMREAFVPNAWKFGISAIFMSLSSTSIAYRAYLIKPAIDKVFFDKNVQSLILIPIQLILVAVATSITTFVHQYLMNKTITKINIEYQKKLFKKLITTDYDFYTTRSSYKIMDLFNDITGLLNALKLVFTGLISELFTMIGLIAVMLYQSPKLAAVAFIGFPIVILPFRIISKKVKKLAQQGQTLSGQTSHSIGETFTLIELVKATASEDKEIEKFNSVSLKNYKLGMKNVRLSLISSPMMEMAGTIGFAGVIWFGGKSVIDGTMTSGAFFTMITALLTIYKPAKSFSNINIQIQTALTSAKRLFITLDKESFVKNKQNAFKLSNIKGNIDFNNVSFYYPIHDKNEAVMEQNVSLQYSKLPALNSLSLSIMSGQNVALVGHSGSGKSTFFKLIQRFYDVSNGSVKVDGFDIRDVTLESLRNSLSIVSQDVLLFNATIRTNLIYGCNRDNITDDEIKNSCDLANATEFIMQLPDGLETMLGPNGAMLSGGQKQRISIARAFLKNAPILLLDEATSALDPISEKLIQLSLYDLMKNKTSITIAHRLSTIKNCDVIFVMKNGKIIETGSHEELLQIDGHYAELYNKQFMKLNNRSEEKTNTLIKDVNKINENISLITSDVEKINLNIGDVVKTISSLTDKINTMEASGLLK